MPGNAAKNWKLIGILLLGFALRLYALGQRPIWYDEAFSILLARQDFAAILRGTAADIQPPLYYFVLHAWLGLGDQAFVARFLSVALSLACLPVSHALARRWFSDRAALWGMLLLAVLPFQVAYAQELRMYSLLEFALLVYFYGFTLIQSRDKGTLGRMMVGAGGAAALYSQSLAILTLVVPFILLIAWRKWEALKRMAVGGLIALIWFAPWLWVMTGQFLSVQESYWISRPGPVEIIQLLLAFNTNQPLAGWMLAPALFISILLLTVLGLEIVRGWREKQEALVTAIALAAVPPLLMFALSYMMRSVFLPRAVIFSSLAYALLLGWLLARVPRASTRAMFGVAGVLIALVSLSFQYSYAEFPRSPFQQADQFLLENAKPGDQIIHDSKLSFLPMHYYDRTLGQGWLPDPPGAASNTLSPDTMSALAIHPEAMDAATSESSRVWFVIFGRAIDEARADGKDQPNLAWLDQRFHRVNVRRFNDLNVYLYER